MKKFEPGCLVELDNAFAALEKASNECRDAEIDEEICQLRDDVQELGDRLKDQKGDEES